MLSDETAFAIAELFDRIGPSHDVITTLVGRAGLGGYDPGTKTREGDPIGKKRRIRTILTSAGEERPQAGALLVKRLVAALRGHGSFQPDSPDYPGSAKIQALQRALYLEGFRLETDGQLLPLSLDGLEGATLTAALEAYVRRALRGGQDDPLLIGNAKDLLEAVARHALVESTGAYPTHANFEATLWQAFDRLGLATPTRSMLELLDADPGRAMEQATLLLGIAENRLRNQQGTGHGRPSAHVLSSDLARFASQASGLISRLMLDRLSRIRDKAA